MCPKGFKSSNSGAALVIFALVLGALVAMISLALDLSRLGEVGSRSRESGRLAVLAASETFFASTSTSLNTRLCRTLSAAQQSVKNNNYSAEFAPVIKFSEVIPNCDLATPAKNAAEGATMEAGLWHYSQPTSASLGQTNPCSGNYPCFQPWTLADAGPTESILPNAFRMTGRIFTKTPFFLADKIFAATTKPTEILTTATVIPRRIMFLVDISNSMVRESHKDRTLDLQRTSPGNGHGDQFAYFLTEPSPSTQFPGCNVSYSNPKPVSFDPGLQDTERSFRQLCGHNGPADQPAAQNPGDNIPTPPTRTFATIATPGDRRAIHFRSEYVQKATLIDSDYQASTKYAGKHPLPTDTSSMGVKYEVGNNRKYYMVDVGKGRTNSSGQQIWDPPQPITGVMRGISQAISLMKQRKISGDRVGIIFFDENITWPRVFLPTDDYDYLLKAVGFTRPQQVASNSDSKTWNVSGGAANLGSLGIDDDPNTFTAAQATADPAAGLELELAIRHGLFPNPESPYTDYNAAVIEGVNLLATARTQTGNQAASDNLVLITDGLGTCCRDSNPAGWPGGIPFGSANKGVICNPKCGSSYSVWNESLIQLRDLSRERVAPMGIPIHMMLVGEEVKPNKQAIQVFDASLNKMRCMTDSEARRMNIQDWARGPIDTWRNGFNTPQLAFDNRSACAWPSDCPGTAGAFFEVNPRMLEVARLTQGRWMPIASPRSTSCNAGGQYQATYVDCSTAVTDNNWKHDWNCTQQPPDYISDLISSNPYSIVEG